MKRCTIIAVLLLSVCLVYAGPAGPADLVDCRARAVFGGECEAALLTELRAAKSEIKIAIYSITRRSVTGALTDAVKRGVSVKVKYDVGSYEWKGMKSAIGFMKRRKVECVPIETKGKYGKMHHKFAVVDRKKVLTGSYNYTTTASTVNYENLVVIESVEIAEAFLKEFEDIGDPGSGDK